MHGCFMFRESTSIKIYLSDMEKFALVFSGLCHDVSHRGYTNNFEMLSYSKLTIRYHDKSVFQYHNQSSFNVFLVILGFGTTPCSDDISADAKRKK